MDYLLKNAICIEPNPARVFPADVQITDGRIVNVARSIDGAPGIESIDLEGKLLMPGNVCSHTHLYSTLARGMPGPDAPPENFVQILERIWWRLDRALDPESIYCSALIGALEAVRAGTTCVFDHHASPSAIEGSLELVATALGEVGLRGVLCYEITDRGGLEARDAGLAGTRAFLKTLRSLPQEPVRGMVGGHASFTLSDQTLRACADLAQEFDTGFHVHVAEDRFDQEDAARKHGRRVTDRLQDHGLLGRRSILAHGVHLSELEIEAISEHGAWLIHNPRSNLNNSVGRTRIEAFGDRVALGTDGIGADIFEESKFGFFRAREAARHSGADRFLRIAAAGQEIASEIFGEPFGRIEPGAMADLAVLDYDSPTPLTSANLAWHWMFGINAAMVESVMINGRWVLRDRQFGRGNIKGYYTRARQAAQALWRRMASIN